MSKTKNTGRKQCCNKKQLGNPVVMMAAQRPDFVSRAINLLVGGVLIVGTGLLAKKFYTEYQRSQALQQYGGTPEGQQAISINEAMSYTNTNEAQIFDTARQITNWPGVQDAYKKLYGNDIIADLQSVKGLDEDELKQFLQIVGAGILKNKDEAAKAAGKSTGTKSIVADNPAKANAFTASLKGAIVYTEHAVNARRMPHTKSTAGFKPNVLETIPAGKYIGNLTGQEQRDYDSPDQPIFLEVEGFMKNAIGSGSTAYKFWVAKSYIKVFTDKSKLNKDTIAKNLHRLGYAPLGRIESEVRSITYAPVFAPDMQTQVAIAEPGIILGEKIMSLKTPKGEQYVKFRTIQGRERWVNSKYTGS